MKTFINSQNPWWLNPKVRFPIEKYTIRQIDSAFDRYFAASKIVTVTGLRQTGKTTLMKNKINHLLEARQSHNLLYINFENNPGTGKEELRKDIMDFIQEIAKTMPHETKGLYIFLDEIQYVPNWQDILKFYFEMNPQIKFVVSGSSSLFIKKGSTESLLGRTIDLKINPFSFKEYLRHAGSSVVIDFDLPKFLLNPALSRFNKLKLYIAKQAELEREYLNYIHFGYFPGTLEMQKNEDKNTYLNESIYTKVLNSDIPALFHIEKKQELVKLFNLLIFETGSIIEINNLASEISIDKNTLYNYLEAIAETNLVSRVMRFQKSKRFPKGVLSKFYTASPNFTFAAQGITDVSRMLPVQIGFLVETDVFQKLRQIMNEIYYFRKGENEIDFVGLIPETPKERYFIEVKYRNRILLKNLRFLKEQMKKEGKGEAFVITKNTIDVHEFKDNGRNFRLWFLPVWAI